MKRKVGRPSKYNEDTTSLLLRAPISVLNEVKQRAGEVNLSSTEYIIGCIITSNTDMVEEMIYKINELQKSYINLAKINSKQAEEINKLSSLMKPSSFVKIVETPEILNDFLEERREEIIKSYLDEDVLSEFLYLKFEDYCLNQNEVLRITHPMEIKLLITKEIINYSKERMRFREQEQKKKEEKENIAYKEKLALKIKKDEERKKANEERLKRLMKDPYMREKILKNKTKTEVEE